MVSFYTPEYRQVVKPLIRSLEKFGLPYDIDEIPDMGGWMANTAYKPTFILEKLKRHKRPTVWLDADAEVVSYPVYFDVIQEDIGVCCENNQKARAGTVFFNYTDNAIKILEGWQRLCKDLNTNDQKHLENTINAMYFDKKATLFLLPQSYYQIFDFKHWGKPVILQNQASRRFR